MAFEKAFEHLKEFNLEEKVLVFDSSSATVSEAANAINTKEKNIVKTLSFIVNDNPILVCVSGDRKIDNKKYKEEFKVKAKMIEFNDVERLVGHQVGGVCPFGIKNNVDVYLDNSLKELNDLYPAVGSSNSAVKLTLNELEKTSNYIKYVDVCKEMENEKFKN